MLIVNLEIKLFGVESVEMFHKIYDNAWIVSIGEHLAVIPGSLAIITFVAHILEEKITIVTAESTFESEDGRISARNKLIKGNWEPGIWFR